MNDPELAAMYSQPPLSDLRTLAGGFRDLAVSAATPPPPPPVASTPVPVAAAPAPVVRPPRIYTSGDGDVTPPQVIKQELPPYQGVLPMTKQGAIEVTIDENGMVEFARMQKSVTVPYDSMALKAAQTWRYVPAVADGKPVKYRKVVAVTVKPRGSSND
jgi:TonB family protein